MSPPKMTPANSVGNGEGELNIIAWAGYAEDGSNDPKVDWVHPFEKATGCTVHDKIGNTSDEMVQLMKTGGYSSRTIRVASQASRRPTSLPHGHTRLIADRHPDARSIHPAPRTRTIADSGPA